MFVIITKAEPYTKDEIEKLQEVFDSYIKTVIDVKKKICSAGADRHFQSEEILLSQGSNQADLWGGGIDIESKKVDCNSFINIRPAQNNTTNEIIDQELRKIYEDLTKYFFSVIYE